LGRQHFFLPPPRSTPLKPMGIPIACWVDGKPENPLIGGSASRIGGGGWGRIEGKEFEPTELWDWSQTKEHGQGDRQPRDNALLKLVVKTPSLR